MNALAAPAQSTLHTAGPVAEVLAGVTVVLAVGAAAAFGGVMVLLWMSVRRRAAPVHTRLFLAAGIGFPAVVLAVLFAYSQWLRPPWRVAPPKDALIIGVTGHMWWWEVRYRDAAGGRDIVGANEIRMPVGRPVYFALATADVLHSFWIPALGGKMDMVPGRLQHLQLQADVPGRWRGQCAEYCGEQHARMALDVVALAPEAFDAWLAAQARPAAVPASPLAVRGREAFARHRCTACHTVRGVSEEGRLGPDLTHVGSRLSLAGGTLPNTPHALSEWIAHTQRHKPGARMPSSDGRLDADTIEALAAWLAELR
jgi:cytochrome c oxidase subunit 2